MELSSLTADGVNSILTEVLSKRGLNYSEPMQNLKMKFDVSELRYYVTSTFIHHLPQS